MKNKVPVKDREFLLHQRGARRMAVVGIDITECGNILKRLARRHSELSKVSASQPSTSGQADVPVEVISRPNEDT